MIMRDDATMLKAEVRDELDTVVPSVSWGGGAGVAGPATPAAPLERSSAGVISKPSGCGTCSSWRAEPAVTLTPEEPVLEGLGVSVQVGTWDWLLLLLLVIGGVWLLTRGGR